MQTWRHQLPHRVTPTLVMPLGPKLFDMLLPLILLPYLYIIITVINTLTLFLRWDPNDVTLCRILPTDKTTQWLVQTTICRRWCRCLADQLWLLMHTTTTTVITITGEWTSTNHQTPTDQWVNKCLYDIIYLRVSMSVLCVWDVPDAEDHVQQLPRAEGLVHSLVEGHRHSLGRHAAPGEKRFVPVPPS